jgi:hypothetical protein
MTTRPLWFWCVLGAVAMSLGWGLRGSIGGGSLGAMIPGAMIGLVLCLMLHRHSDAGLIAAFAAIGVGLGGQETYGQTVGLSLQPQTFWWAILGFVIKGAAWGLLGGAFIGIALDRQRYTVTQLLAGFAIMAFGTWLGWQYLNSPKLIYFSIHQGQTDLTPVANHRLKDGSGRSSGRRCRFPRKAPILAV